MNTPTTAPTVYPVHVEAELDPGLSRGLWLVKWLLAIPHYLVLAFLWPAFAVASLLAFFSILFTGRYPRALFDFNVGVLRWTWRVAYYAYGALGTDRYPPFTLAEVPDYPAHLSVDRPERLSRGLVLVKWWLLAIPHYLVLALLVGGVGYGVEGADDDPRLTFSLIGILVLVAGVTLLFTGRYPQRLFDLVLGLNRWVLRVAGYVALMTDRYPPFSLDQGGHEGAVRTGPPSGTGPAAPPDAASVAPPVTAPVTGPGTAPAAPLGAPRSGWTAGRVVSLVLGSLLVLGALGTAGTGAALAVADQIARDSDGFLMSPAQELTTGAFAIASEDLEVHSDGFDGPAAFLPDRLVGDVRLTVDSLDGEPLFVGVAPAADAARFLDGVRHDTLLELRDGDPVYRSTEGGAPAAPAGRGFWVAQGSGVDDVRVTWPLEDGDWTVVVMDADGSAGVAADVAVGAELPGIATVVAVLLVTAALMLLVGGLLVAVPVRAASRENAQEGELS
ncbi:DUF4389 domain-containing protein [Nocardioides solisilvae]|uniref:DUF4389 domain-containing protein n=1 Tax=Nocardioides solisilvae TaxID=1542435 RepID=UPI000D750C11|nr:DUF4389 domain-containing protein [Nocardioides solisilvae]